MCPFTVSMLMKHVDAIILKLIPSIRHFKISLSHVVRSKDSPAEEGCFAHAVQWFLSCGDCKKNFAGGLVCNLLGITNHRQLEKHPFKGALVENLVISELKKNSFNAGMQPSLFYWKNKTGLEIDCIIHQPAITTLVEIKAGQDYQQRLL